MNAQRSVRMLSLITAMNGGSIVAITSICTLAAWIWGGPEERMVSLSLLLGGMAELWGRHCLNRQSKSVIFWLCGSQLLCLSAIVSYAIVKVVTLDPGEILAYIPENTLEVAHLYGVVDIEKTLEQLAKLLSGLLISMALLHQGGLGVYYYRSAKKLKFHCGGVDNNISQ